MSTPTWYDLLGVAPSAEPDEIRAAWRGAIADLDPTERRFATLNEAAGVLLDPARRRAYDEQLRAAEPDPTPDEDDIVDAEIVEDSDGQASAVPALSSKELALPQPTEQKRRPTPYLVPGWVLAVIAVIALASAVLAGVLATRDPADKVVQAEVQLSSGSKVTRIEEHAQEAEAAAKEAIVPVLSYDYRHLDADQAKAHGFLTDSYRKDYDKLFALIKQNAPGTQTVITTKVVGSGLVRVDADRVQVLLFVDRPTTNKTQQTPVPYQDQVTATMQRVGDSWLVDDLVTTPIQD